MRAGVGVSVRAPSPRFETMRPATPVPRLRCRGFGTAVLVLRFWYCDLAPPLPRNHAPCDTGAATLAPRPRCHDTSAATLAPRPWRRDLGAATLAPRPWPRPRLETRRPANRWFASRSAGSSGARAGGFGIHAGAPRRLPGNATADTPNVGSGSTNRSCFRFGMLSHNILERENSERGHASWRWRLGSRAPRHWRRDTGTATLDLRPWPRDSGAATLAPPASRNRAPGDTGATS